MVNETTLYNELEKLTYNYRTYVLYNIRKKCYYKINHYKHIGGILMTREEMMKEILEEEEELSKKLIEHLKQNNIYNILKQRNSNFSA